MKKATLILALTFVAATAHAKKAVSIDSSDFNDIIAESQVAERQLQADLHKKMGVERLDKSATDFKGLGQELAGEGRVESVASPSNVVFESEDNQLDRRVKLEKRNRDRISGEVSESY